MKKTLASLIVLLIVQAVYAAKPTSATVGATSVKLVAAKPPTGINAWQRPFFYKQGTVVLHLKRYYMAVADGTSGTDAPIHTSGEVSDGGVTWRWIEGTARNGVSLTLNSEGTVYWSFSDYAATQGDGLKSIGVGSGIKFGSDYQGAISAISSSNNEVIIGIQEW